MPNFQMSGMGVLSIVCDPSWTPCQKAQARAKAADLNHQAKGPGGPLNRDPAYGPAIEQAKKRAQAAWSANFNRMRGTPPRLRTSPHLGTQPNNYPSGDEHDLTDPCMEAEMVGGRAPPGRWAADHRVECIAGGSTQGPMKMLDGQVNSAFGAGMKAALNKGPLHTVETDVSCN